MKTIYTLLTIFIFSTNLFAQKFIQEWYKPLEGTGERKWGAAILTTPDDNFYIAGKGQKPGYGLFYYSKIDSAGQEIFTTFAEEQYNDANSGINRIIIDQQNRFITIGTFEYFSRKTFFTQLTDAGEILNITMQSAEQGYQGGNDIVQTPDSGYLVASYLYDYYVGLCFALRKLDNTGNFIWDTAFVDPDGNHMEGQFRGMESINDSTYVLAGFRDYDIGSAVNSDMVFAKVQLRNDTAHLTKFIIYQKDGTNEHANDILILPNNQGYIMCGQAPNPNSLTTLIGNIVRTDTAGNVIWDKTYARISNGITDFIRIHLDKDTNILVLAQTGSGSQDASLLKYSLDGDLLQKKHFDYGTNEFATDFAVSKEGKIYITTWGPSYATLLLKVKDICPVISPEVSIDDTIPKPGEDIVIHVQDTKDIWSYSLQQINGEQIFATQMGNEGELTFTVSGLTNEDIANGIVVSVVEPEVDCIKYSDTLYLEFYDGIDEWSHNHLIIAPNPFHNYIMISAINTNELPRSARIYNLEGQMLLEIKDMTNHKKIDLSTLPKGVYIIGLQDTAGDIIYKKIVKD